MKYIDMHCDTISRLYDLKQKGGKENLMRNEGHLDLERMKTGSCLAQNFALFTGLKDHADPFEHCMALCDLFKKEMEENSGAVRQVVTAAEILENEKAGRMSAVLTIEEGAVCKGSTDILRRFYGLGVRMMTLTWNYENDLAYPNRADTIMEGTIPETEHGLTEKGFEFVELMEELGMILDVSHLGDAGFLDVLKVSKRPFAASHSNARAIASHVRNLTDEMIRALSERGGVMGINFYSAFLKDGERGEKTRMSRVKDMVAHIRHIRNVGGIDCIGLGSDYDGISCGLELTSPASFYLLEEALLQGGFTREEVEKIFYKNVLRLYKDVWRQ